jgi:ribosomal protein S15P/S13E
MPYPKLKRQLERMIFMKKFQISEIKKEVKKMFNKEEGRFDEKIEINWSAGRTYLRADSKFGLEIYRDTEKNICSIHIVEQDSTDANGRRSSVLFPSAIEHAQYIVTKKIYMEEVIKKINIAKADQKYIDLRTEWKSDRIYFERGGVLNYEPSWNYEEDVKMLTRHINSLVRHSKRMEELEARWRN